MLSTHEFSCIRTDRLKTIAQQHNIRISSTDSALPCNTAQITVSLRSQFCIHGDDAIRYRSSICGCLISADTSYIGRTALYLRMRIDCRSTQFTCRGPAGNSAQSNNSSTVIGHRNFIISGKMINIPSVCMINFANSAANISSCRDAIAHCGRDITCIHAARTI